MTEFLPHGEAAHAYLSRNPHANRELLLALRYEQVVALHVVWHGNDVSGVLVQGPGPFNTDPHWLRLDADDADAAAALLRRVTLDRRLVVSLHRPWMEPLAEQFGLHLTTAGVYGFLARRANLQLPPDPDVRLLNDGDWPLVERSQCGWSRGYFERLFEEGRRPWVIVMDDRIASRASSGYPTQDCEEVVGVWTHPRWRGQGLARRLVATVAHDIGARMPFISYTTTFDNHASQTVARSVGFEVCFTARSYQLR